MSSTNKNTGFIIALACGILGLLAFFAFPFISVAGVGATALTIATGGAQLSGSLAILWVEALLAGLITLMAGLQFSKSATVDRNKTAGGCLLALGITGSVICILFIILLNSVSFVGGFLLSALGLGFWAFFLAAIGTIVGAVMARKQVAQMASGAPLSTPNTQYPPNQQPSMQQYPPNQQPSMQQYMSNQQSLPSQYPPYQQPSSQQYPPYQQPSSSQYPPFQPPQEYPPSAGGQ